MKPCKICRTEFKPVSIRSVTCGSEECKRANYILNRDKGRTGVKGIDIDTTMKNRFIFLSVILNKYC